MELPCALIVCVRRRQFFASSGFLQNENWTVFSLVMITKCNENGTGHKGADTGEKVKNWCASIGEFTAQC